MSRRTLGIALRKVVPLMFLGVLPVLLLGYGAVVAVTDHSVAVDFRAELYPEAQLVLHGQNPFPSPDADLSSGINRIFPIPAALLVSPLTVFSAHTAAAIFSLILVAALALTLYLLGVRDWRVYGAVALWPSTMSAVQTGNLTILLGLCAALGWRYRGRTIAGVPIGLAIALKLYLWPLAIWLVAIRRPAAAAVAGVVAALGFLMTAPFTSLHDYVTVLGNLGRTFAPVSATIQGLLMQLGSDAGPAKIVTYAAGAALIAVAYRRRSFGLFVAAALTLSPIVWLHYFILMALPLAITRKRFTPLWLAPLALWFYPGNFEDVRAWHVVLALVTAAVVFVLSERRPGPVALHERAPELTPAPA
jgi:hypothetical protein